MTRQEKLNLIITKMNSILDRIEFIQLMYIDAENNSEKDYMSIWSEKIYQYQSEVIYLKHQLHKL